VADFFIELPDTSGELGFAQQEAFVFEDLSPALLHLRLPGVALALEFLEALPASAPPPLCAPACL
jgi:hypothetical protein